MLVLVAVRKVWFAQPLFISSLLILVMVVAPAPLAGQSDSRSESVSILVKPDSGSQDSSPAANGIATIEANPASNSASFSNQSYDSAPAFPDQPRPPRQLLMPQSPSQDSFTKPFVSSEKFDNELRSDNVDRDVVPASFNAPVQGQSKATGTLATTNQTRQNPGSFQVNRAPAQPSQFSRPPARSPVPDNFAGSQKTFTPPIVNSFGDSANSSSRSSVTSGAPAAASFSNNSGTRNFASSNSSSSNFLTSDPSAPKASNWRTEPGQSNQNQANNQSGYPSNRTASTQALPVIRSNNRTAQSGSRFNAGANSNYNQGVNPNIASGVPRVAPLQQLPNNRNIASQPVRRTQQSFNRDSSVRPTGFAQPTAPRKIKTDVAKQLIARYSTDGVNPQELGGQPVKLFEMLSQPISTDQRRPMVHQFWDTYLDWASLVNAKQYSSLLDDIPGSSGADSAVLEMAKMEAKNEVLASEIELVKSQSKLAQFMPNRSSSLPPPIPNDLPLIQKYNTQYERYRQSSLMPANLLGIDKMLPKTLELISSRADTVQLAQSANQTVVAGVRNRQSSVSDALHTAKAWRTAEQNLLVAVMDYNHAICDYALTVSRGYQSPQQVVGMLIAKPKATNTNSNSSITQQFRNARNTVGNGQQVNSQANSQRFNQGQNSQFGNNQINNSQFNNNQISNNQARNLQNRNNQPVNRPQNFNQQQNFNRPQNNQARNFSRPNNQARNNQPQNNQPNTARFGGANSSPRSSTGFGQSTNFSQGGQSGFQQSETVSRTVEAGSASPFRSTSSGFGTPNSGASNVNRNSNTAAKSSQGFSLESGAGFKPPAQTSFGGQSSSPSQFAPPPVSTQRPAGAQPAQNSPFVPPSSGSGSTNNSQFKAPVEL